MKLERSAVWAGFLAAIASSLCCITPVIAFLAGTSGLAASFSWIEPARPYLLAVTGLALGLAWYQNLKPQPADDCGCRPVAKRSFFQTRSFLAGMTLFALAASAFPYYSNHFFPESSATLQPPSNSFGAKTAAFSVEGMTCAGCEGHVRAEVEKLPGIFNVAVSYREGSATVQFDEKQTSIAAIGEAIATTGYEVVYPKKQNQ